MTLTDFSRLKESMARTIYLMLAAILMTSCAAPMASTKEELQSLSENEGVVIGSILFIAVKGVENESGWAFLRGIKTDDLEWTVSFSELGFKPFATTYAVFAARRQVLPKGGDGVKLMRLITETEVADDDG